MNVTLELLAPAGGSRFRVEQRGIPGDLAVTPVPFDAPGLAASAATASLRMPWWPLVDRRWRVRLWGDAQYEVLATTRHGPASMDVDLRSVGNAEVVA